MNLVLVYKYLRIAANSLCVCAHKKQHGQNVIGLRVCEVCGTERELRLHQINTRGLCSMTGQNLMPNLQHFTQTCSMKTTNFQLLYQKIRVAQKNLLKQYKKPE